MSDTLNRSDPITAEALERMGFRKRNIYWVKLSISNKTGDSYYLYVDPVNGTVKTYHNWLADCTTLGDLADLCRCLKIELTEVPE